MNHQANPTGVHQLSHSLEVNHLRRRSKDKDLTHFLLISVNYNVI
jgi:hypothetical protein